MHHIKQQKDHGMKANTKTHTKYVRHTTKHYHELFCMIMGLSNIKHHKTTTNHNVRHVNNR